MNEVADRLRSEQISPPRYTEARATFAMKWKIAAIVSTCVALTLLIGILNMRGSFSRHPLDPQAVVTQVKQLRQLVTVKYSIQDVVGLREEKVPFGEESILLMVKGDAVAGVDLSAVTPRDVRYVDKRAVIVTLPRAKLLDTTLDEKQTKVWDRRITWWTPWVPYDPDLEHKARLQAIDNVRSAALEMGILDQAQKNAESSIREFLGAFELTASFKTRPMD
jgi:Protein of unknown function (DUF4230)